MLRAVAGRAAGTASFLVVAVLAAAPIAGWGAISAASSDAGPECVQAGSTNLASIATNAAGVKTSDKVITSTCPEFALYYGHVAGICYGHYAVQVNAYGMPPPDVEFSMWSRSASCWGIRVSEPSDPKFVYWNGPLVTRGFSFGYNAPLIPTGGILGSDLNRQYASSGPCPAGGKSGSVCIKWSMSVPGVEPRSAVNTATATYTNWDALIDIYFHDVAVPATGQGTTFDLQIYQMLMDWQNPGGNVPNWATYIVGRHATKTIGGITYLVSVNMGNPGTERSSSGACTWIGCGGGTYNAVSLFPLPTYPTASPQGSGSYLWGAPSLLHDVGGIISWLSHVESRGFRTGIFDDHGDLLFDNARKSSVTTPLLNPGYYLTGINPGFEVILANPGVPGSKADFPNNTVYTTTDYWVALPGEAIAR